MPTDNVREKLQQAVRALTTGDSRIQVRLAGAAGHLIRVRPEDLPADIHGEFSEILHELTHQEPAGTEGFIQATTSRIAAKEGIGLAARILRLYESVCLAGR